VEPGPSLRKSAAKYMPSQQAVEPAQDKPSAMVARLENRISARDAREKFGGRTMGLAILGIGLGVGLLVVGAAYGIGKLATAAVEGIARQPEAAGNIRGTAIVLAALIEGFTFFALIVCLLASNKVDRANWVEAGPATPVVEMHR